MQQNEWTGPSGSRWEPVPQGVSPAAASASEPIGAGAPGTTATPRRRYRRPVVAVLLTLLGVGTVATGAAYAQTGSSTPAGDPAGQTSSQVVRGDHGGRHQHGLGGERS